MSQLLSAARMPAITGQLQRSSRIVAVLTAVLRILSYIAITRGVLALVLICHGFVFLKETLQANRQRRRKTASLGRKGVT